MNRDGTEFPLSFRMKNLSITSLMCRHPIASGFIQLIFGSLIYGTITWGRVLFLSVMTFMTIVVANVEEKDLVARGGAGYRRFR